MQGLVFVQYDGEVSVYPLAKYNPIQQFAQNALPNESVLQGFYAPERVGEGLCPVWEPWARRGRESCSHLLK